MDTVRDIQTKIKIMKKTMIKIVLSAMSILGISFLIWLVFLLNPSLSYAEQTQFGQITVYHNQDLMEGTGLILQDAIDIIKRADIYDESLRIQLCLHDDKLYPKLFPFAGGTAYAFFTKAVVYASEPNFQDNSASFKWEVNNYELRKYNLTRLLAHEFMHNVQYYHDPSYQILSTLGAINWKLEGHAEYISREFKNDGLLKDKIAKYLLEEGKEHVGFPVFTLADGTIQILPYFKYALVIQYLMEIEGLNFDQIASLEPAIDKPFEEMMKWNSQ